LKLRLITGVLLFKSSTKKRFLIAPHTLRLFVSQKCEPRVMIETPADYRSFAF
jgi:hypothetical protein